MEGVASTEIPGTTTVTANVPRQDIAIHSETRQPSLPPTTTVQEDLTKAGQRRINLIWEYTQATIAIAVVFATMGSGVYSMVYDKAAVPTIIAVAFGTIVGFYFSRTNHEAIGGMGEKPEKNQYIGR